MQTIYTLALVTSNCFALQDFFSFTLTQSKFHGSDIRKKDDMDAMSHIYQANDLHAVSVFCCIFISLYV